MRPRGRRFSDRGRPAGRGQGPAGPAARRRPDAPAALPRAEALDAISLTSDDGQVTTPTGPPEEAAAAETAELPGEPDAAAAHTARLPNEPNAAAAQSVPLTSGPRAAAAESTKLPTEPGAAAAEAAQLPGEPEATGVVARFSGPAWPVRADHRSALGTSSPGAGESQRRGSILPGGSVVTAGPPESGQDAVTPPVFLIDASRVALTWARGRHLGLSSACGISVALAGCAAVWFSAGTTIAIIRGVAALWASYLVLAAGRTIAGRAAAPDSVPAGDRRQTGPAAWLAALGSSLAEAIVYLGLVLGAAAERWPGSWKLGITVVGLVAVRSVMTVCSTPYGFSERPASVAGRMAEAIVTMATGGRILVIGVVAPIWGARAALLVLVAWAISSVAYGLAGRAAPDVLPEGTGPDGGGPVAASATLLRLRDDGALARGLGALVRGNVLPLPPAILGLAAVSALAALGLHGLPGALTVGPAIVMLLAAPGSANPHAGRFDWLVPVLLVGTQVLFLAATGQGERVPGPVIFALVAALLVRYAELAWSGRPVFLTRPRRRLGWGREYGTELGWEGRVLVAGLSAALGIATAGYIALTAYLLLLVSAKVLRSCLAPDDEPR